MFQSIFAFVYCIYPRLAQETNPLSSTWPAQTMYHAYKSSVIILHTSTSRHIQHFLRTNNDNLHKIPISSALIHFIPPSWRRSKMWQIKWALLVSLQQILICGNCCLAPYHQHRRSLYGSSSWHVFQSKVLVPYKLNHYHRLLLLLLFLLLLGLQSCYTAIKAQRSVWDPGVKTAPRLNDTWCDAESFQFH